MWWWPNGRFKCDDPSDLANDRSAQRATGNSDSRSQPTALAAISVCPSAKENLGKTSADFQTWALYGHLADCPLADFAKVRRDFTTGDTEARSEARQR